MKIAIASDHAGFDLKERIGRFLKDRGHEVVDFGARSTESSDYPDFGGKAAEAVAQGEADRAVLICGTGIGMSIVANRFSGVRAALCHSVETAKVARLHNDANVLVLGQRILSGPAADEITATWLETKFEGGRHQRRLSKIESIGRIAARPAARK